MPAFVTLSCPTCGARLQIGNDLQRFACAHCGNEHIVKRDGGAVSLFPNLEGAERMVAGVDRTAIELTIARLEREIKAGQEASAEIRTIKEYYTVHPNEPVCAWKSLWQDAAIYILQRRNPNHRSSTFGSLLNIFDGGCSSSEANKVLQTLTLVEIDNLLQWLGSTDFTLKYQRDCLPDLTRHLRRLKSLEDLRASIPGNEVELRNLRQKLRS